jgi:uncharacterized protein YlxW (UPF0749 family)
LLGSSSILVVWRLSILLLGLLGGVTRKGKTKKQNDQKKERQKINETQTKQKKTNEINRKRNWDTAERSSAHMSRSRTDSGRALELRRERSARVPAVGVGAAVCYDAQAARVQALNET